MPLASSPTNVVTCCPSGELSYAYTPDAVASAGLGWVVAYPVNVGGYNAINVSTELGGGTTITYTTDLFNAGITTSSRGDWYLNYQTYQGGNRVTPIQQGVVYRVSGTPATYLGATIRTSIDPSQWFYYQSNNRCTGNTPCYTPGDFFRPAMNAFTGGSIPMVLSSSNTNDVFQSFIQDPQMSAATGFLPTLTPFENGSDISSLGILTPAHMKQMSEGRTAFIVSSMKYAQLQALGLVP